MSPAACSALLVASLAATAMSFSSMAVLRRAGCGDTATRRRGDTRWAARAKCLCLGQGQKLMAISTLRGGPLRDCRNCEI
eukprot:13875832-Alexandrium_andersonii.AAC.1